MDRDGLFDIDWALERGGRWPLASATCDNWSAILPSQQLPFVQRQQRSVTMAKKITFIANGCDVVGMMQEICAAGLRAATQDTRT
jgi:hypothetical protein